MQKSASRCLPYLSPVHRQTDKQSNLRARDGRKSELDRCQQGTERNKKRRTSKATMTSVTAAHNKTPTRNPFIIAIALGAGLFLLLQLVANRLLPRLPDSSSLIMAPSASYRQVRRSAFEMPVDIFNDEFFSSPFLIDSGLMELKKEMDREMEELSGGVVSPLLRRQQSIWKGFGITEDNEKVTVTVSAPEGVTKDDINIEIIDGTVMHISGSSKQDTGGSVSVVRFDKRFALGRSMEQDKIAANLKDGVLTITTPKAGHLFKEKEVRKIPIKVEL